MANPPVTPPRTPGAPRPGTQGAQNITAPRAAPFKIEPIQRRERYLKLMIYGNYGVGKTLLAATAALVPSMREVLILNAEAGDLTLSDFEEEHGVKLDGVTIPDFRTLGRINEFLRQHCLARQAGDLEKLKQLQSVTMQIPVDQITEPRQYNTVIIDSLSEIEAYCFNQLLGVTDTTRLDEEGMPAEFAEYKKNHNMMLRLVRAFRDLPMHVIFIAGQSYTQDELKRMKYSPDLTGKLASKVQGFMDMVGYYASSKTEDKTERRLYVTPTPRFDAKHRYAAFKGDFFLDPTIQRILEQTGLAEKSGATLK